MSNSATLLSDVTNTIWNDYLHAIIDSGKPFIPHLHSTLNEKLSIPIPEDFETTKYPASTYYMVGIGGHKITLGSNDLQRNMPVEFKRNQPILNRAVPFVIRPLDQPLTSEERSTLRLRTEQEIDGVMCELYWCKLLDEVHPPTILKGMPDKDRLDGLEVYEPTLQDTVTNNQATVFNEAVYPINEAYITRYTQEADVAAKTVEELNNSIITLYGDETYSIISEVAICSGVEFTAQKSINGVMSRYQEIAHAQSMSFTNCIYHLPSLNGGFKYTVDSAADNPIYDYTSD